MFKLIKALFAPKPFRGYTGANWLEHRAELSRQHIEKAVQRKIDEMGSKYLCHPANRIQRRS